MKYIQMILCSFFILTLSACGGGGGGGGSDDDFTPLDTTVDYDLAQAFFGIPGVSRTESGSGSDTDGNSWTYSQTLTTLASPDPGGPCLVSETQTNSTLTLTEAGGFVIVASGPACFTTSGFIQETFDLDESDNPDNYSLLTTAGDFPLTARLGNGGSLGSWNNFEDTNGDFIYDGINGDTFTGSVTGTWRLEDQMGKAALVLSYVIRDEFGTQEGSETTTVFLNPAGSVSTITRVIDIVGFGTISLTGSIN